MQPNKRTSFHPINKDSSVVDLNILEQELLRLVNAKETLELANIEGQHQDLPHHFRLVC